MPEKIGLEAVFDTSKFDSGLNAYTAGLNLANSATATAASGLNFMGNVAIGATRRLGELAVDGFVRAAREAERYAESVLKAAIDGSALETSLARITPSLVEVTRVNFAPFFAQLDSLIERSAPAFLGVVSAAEQALGGLGQRALSWGEGFIGSFAQGIINGAQAVIDSLTQIGNLVTFWLSPGSPPRLLPDLDSWGTSAINQWLGGWTKGDFSVFDDLSSTLEGLIRSLPVPTGEEGGVISRIIGTREGLAKAVDELRTVGTVSQATMDAIIGQVGTADDAVRSYLQSLIKMQATNQAVSEAQAKLNAATKAYDALLKPIEDKLGALDEVSQQLDEDQRKASLAKVLQDPGATASEKRRAQLEIERIDAERAHRAALLQGKAAVDAAQNQLDAAKETQGVAQDEYDAKKALLKLQADSNDLLKQQLAILERLSKVPAGVGGVGPGPKPPTGKATGPSIPNFRIDTKWLDDLKKTFKEKLDALQKAWTDAWKAISDKLAPVREAIEKKLLPALGQLWDAIFGNLPPVEELIAGFITLIVDNLALYGPPVIEALANAISWMADMWTKHSTEIIGAVVAIGAVFAAIGIAGLITAIGAAIAALVTPINIIIAAAGLLGAAWAVDWGGIQGKTAAVWAWLEPVLAKLGNWLQVAIPAALQYMSDFFTKISLPAMTAVWSWITDTLFPTLGELWTWLSETLTDALQKLSDFWTGTLRPAIEGVWTWMSTVVFPFWESLGNLLSAIVGEAVKELARIWKEVLQPALEGVHKFLDEKIKPILEGVSKNLNETLGPAITTLAGVLDTIRTGALDLFKKTLDGIGSVIKDITGWINGLAEAIRGLPEPPGQFQHHSPSPFEQSLRGISTAMRILTADLGHFRMANLDLAGPAMQSAGLLSNSTSHTSITNNERHYHLNVSSNQLSQGIQSDFRIIAAMEPG